MFLQQHKYNVERLPVGATTLQHFSPQPQPFLSLDIQRKLPMYFSKRAVLTSSRKVEECKALGAGGDHRGGAAAGVGGAGAGGAAAGMRGDAAGVRGAGGAAV